jgi:hypothetical protein
VPRTFQANVPVLSPDMVCVAMRAFRFNGVDLDVGDPLPEGVSPKKVEQLCNLRYVEIRPRPQATAKGKAAKAAVPEPEEETDNIDLDALKKSELVALAKQHRVDSAGTRAELIVRLRAVLD